MSSDLDGFYLWLGPTGDAAYANASWDTAFGGELAALRVREGAPLGAIGGAVALEKFSAHDGARMSIEAVAGTRLFGKTMAGVTLGPAIEMSAIEHPRLGVEAAAWMFVGVTPFVRVGAVETNGAFVEVGLQLLLPVLRR